MSSSDLQTYNVQDRILQDDEEGERQPIVGGGSGGKVGFLLRPWIQNWFVKEAICEAAATCLFVFIGAGAEFNTTVLTDIALAHGMAIMILISSTAKMSGGHLNPAVSFAALIMKQISLKKMLIYWAAQLIGGFLGGLLLMAATDPLTWNRLGAQTLSSGTNPAQGILW
jgi:glycerol uptake facilitator-like aquaporin